MKKSIWFPTALILLWLCSAVGCQEKTETLLVPDSVLSTSNIMMPLRSKVATDISAEKDTLVFVCKSAGAKRYHFKSNCCGLKKCKQEIEQLNVTDAQNIGLTICKYEN